MKAETKQWWSEERRALFGTPNPNGSVTCGLTPRGCTIPEGGAGFCKVRINRGGQLQTVNYGKAVHATEEVIETEAIYHYAPGSPILSMGNVGCMFNCDYCQNWATSQAKHIDASHVHTYTPEEVVRIAVQHGIRVISWTYNDPVVWHEFVLDTAKLARKAGLINLYKSAFYITPKAIEQLTECIDIFSISLKSMDPEYYRMVTKGKLEPVLDGIQQVFRSGIHLELSTLMITDLSDNEKTATDISEFVLEKLSPDVPLHFVRFHPDYKMRSLTRTPIPRLGRAREIAKGLGIRHCYIGNVDQHEGTHSYCAGCGHKLVHRYGLVVSPVGMNDGACSACGLRTSIRSLPPANGRSPIDDGIEPGMEAVAHVWEGEIRALHIQLLNRGPRQRVIIRRVGRNGSLEVARVLELGSSESHRLLIARGSDEEAKVEVLCGPGVTTSLHEVFDRAHFPTVSVDQEKEQGKQKGDVSPLPDYPGKQVLYESGRLRVMR